MAARALVLLLVLSTGCASMKQNDSEKQASTPRADELATRLAGMNVAEMAMGLASDPQVQAAQTEFPDTELYAALVEDRKRPDAVRFAAALVLKSRNAKADPAATAEAFAAGLQKDLVGWAYPWGWLWHGEDPLGHLGNTFIEIGQPAVPALTALLDDATSRSSYLGSEEATEMAMKRYRVKDFAAFYLSQITGIALPWEQNLAKRDEAIATLRAQLPK